MEMLGVFPIPVGIKKLDRKFSAREEHFFKKTSKMTYGNYGNLVSTNRCVLDDPDLSEINEFCLNSAREFIKIYNPPKNYFELYITQSWINYTSKEQSHHKHSHPNSFISGVFYINANKEHDKIFFLSPHSPLLTYETETYNIFNSEEWFVPVETNMLVLFPSSLKHYVRVNTEPHVRTSLAFNTFVKGTFGTEKTLTELNL